jgi:hypothetical protein
MFLQVLGLRHTKFLQPFGLTPFRLPGPAAALFLQGFGLGLLRDEVGLGTFFENFCSTNVLNNTNVL